MFSDGNAIYRLSGLGNCRMLFCLSIAFSIIDLINIPIRTNHVRACVCVCVYVCLCHVCVRARVCVAACYKITVLHVASIPHTFLFSCHIQRESAHSLHHFSELVPRQNEWWNMVNIYVIYNENHICNKSHNCSLEYTIRALLDWFSGKKFNGNTYQFSFCKICIQLIFFYRKRPVVSVGTLLFWSGTKCTYMRHVLVRFV